METLEVGLDEYRTLTCGCNEQAVFLCRPTEEHVCLRCAVEAWCETPEETAETMANISALSQTPAEWALVTYDMFLPIMVTGPVRCPKYHKDGRVCGGTYSPFDRKTMVCDGCDSWVGIGWEPEACLVDGEGE